MNPFTVHFELAVQDRRKHRQAGVVIAGNEQQPGSCSAPGQQQPHDVGVLRAPEKALPETQGIDDVADEHDLPGLHAVEEVSQLAHARAAVSQMNTGQEQRAHPDGRGV
jgi:hypothetical protein